MSLASWMFSVLVNRHRFVHENDESYIKCACGETVSFEELDILPEDVVPDLPDENA